MNNHEFVKHMIGAKQWSQLPNGESHLRVGPFDLTADWRWTQWNARLHYASGAFIASMDRLASLESAQEMALNLLANRITMGNGFVLTPWTVYDGYCAMRYFAGADPNDIATRVAFIEKTPRVRVMRAGPSLDRDSYNWWSGPKGSGCSGDAEKEQAYGFDPRSRQWCDEQLVAMGYVLT